MDTLTLDEIAALRDLGTLRYQEQVVSLFSSGRATLVHWLEMAEALSALSESSQRAMVAEIDRAVLAHLRAMREAREGV